MKTFSFVWLVGLLAALVCVAESRAQPKASPDVYGEFDETEADVDVSSPQQKVYFLAEPDNVTTRLGERIVLACRIANINSTAAVQWTADDFGLGTREIISQQFPRMRFTDENPDSK